MGPRWDRRVSGGGEVCASAEGERRPRPLPQLLSRCVALNPPAAAVYQSENSDRRKDLTFV